MHKYGTLVIAYIVLIISIAALVQIVALYHDNEKIQDRIITSCKTRSEPLVENLIAAMNLADQKYNADTKHRRSLDPYAGYILDLKSLPACDNIFDHGN